MSGSLPIASSAAPQPLTQARTPISIRLATMADLPFIDRLQKMHTKQVGWMPTKQLEGKIGLGHVHVAEEVIGPWSLVIGEDALPRSSANAKDKGPMTRDNHAVGYIIGNDQYFKRDDVGIVYQVNVMPGRQRGLVGAMLLKTLFEQAAWGCKLFCCWCAQDIEANRFWEAMGFTAIAYRVGSRTRGIKKSDEATERQSDEGGGVGPSPASGLAVASSLRRSAPSARIHIFWQKRINAGDTTTPWWYPSKTGAGSLREDRLVLPIPQGLHWRDEMPALVLPGGQTSEPRASASGGRGLGDGGQPRLGGRGSLKSPRTKHVPVSLQKQTEARNGLWFSVPQPGEAMALVKAEPQASDEVKGKRETVRHDPRLVAAARELRDRWMEQLNDQPMLPSTAKYEPARLPGRRAKPRLATAGIADATTAPGTVRALPFAA